MSLEAVTSFHHHLTLKIVGLQSASFAVLTEDVEKSQTLGRTLLQRFQFTIVRARFSFEPEKDIYDCFTNFYFFLLVHKFLSDLLKSIIRFSIDYL